MPKCKYCSTKFEARNSLDRFCSPSHAIAWLNTQDGKKAQQKAKQKKDRAYRQETKDRRLELNRKTLGWQHKQTQIAFNKLRRLEEFKWFKDRGKRPYCISCLKKYDQSNPRAWHIGHYKSVGASGALRYEEVNTNLQCGMCNTHLSGNIGGTATTIGYRNGLSHRFGVRDGIKRLNWLEENQSKVKKWTCDELEQMRGRFNARIRELEKQLAQ